MDGARHPSRASVEVTIFWTQEDQSVPAIGHTLKSKELLSLAQSLGRLAARRAFEKLAHQHSAAVAAEVDDKPGGDAPPN